MILFYSVYCNHCKMLLDHIKRYDKEKIIKLVSIDDLRAKNIGIESKIHSVPAFMILPSKELLFGKTVFDHLLLPGRGILCSTQNTRLDKSGTGDNDKIPLANTDVGKDSVDDGEPLAFTLNSASFSDSFSNIEDDTKELTDKNYRWDFITNDSNISDGIKNVSSVSTCDGSGGSGEGKMTKSEKTNQSLEELKKLRDSQKF
jgi:hypothetical protein